MRQDRRMMDVRAAWQLFEPIHALVYFAPESKEAYESAGLKGGWMGYFASRSAPMGPVGPEVVTATFYNFHPAMVARAIPDAWALSTPERVLQGRLSAINGALERTLGEWARSKEIYELNELLEHAGAGCSMAGRPLFAAHAGLSTPRQPVLRLWHNCTLLREHRGDGHVAALVTADLDAREAHLTLAATGAVPGEMLRLYRGWSSDDWADAAQGLRGRGLLDEADGLTAEGERVRTWVEAKTDELAYEPWQALGPDATKRALDLLLEPRRRILAAGEIVFPNPMGLPR
jgi:hypothetical protein